MCHLQSALHMLANPNMQSLLIERIGPGVPLWIFLHWCVVLASLHLNLLLLKLLELVKMGRAILFLVCLACLRMATHEKLVALGDTLEVLAEILTSAQQSRFECKKGTSTTWTTGIIIV